MSKNKKIFLLGLFSLILVAGSFLFFTQTVLAQRGGDDGTVTNYSNINPSAIKECVNHGAEYIKEDNRIIGCRWINGEGCICTSDEINCIDSGCKWVTNFSGRSGGCVCNYDTCKDWNDTLQVCNNTNKVSCLERKTSYWDKEGKYCVSNVSEEKACQKKGGTYNFSNSSCILDNKTRCTSNDCIYDGNNCICPEEDLRCSSKGCVLSGSGKSCICNQTFKPTSSLSSWCQSAYCGGCSLDDYNSADVINDINFPITQICTTFRSNYPLKGAITQIASKDNLDRIKKTNSYYVDFNSVKYPIVGVDKDNIENNLFYILGLPSGTSRGETINYWVKNINSANILEKGSLYSFDSSFWQSKQYYSLYKTWYDENKYVVSDPNEFNFEESNDTEKMVGSYFQNKKNINEYKFIPRENMCTRTDAENYKDQNFCSSSGCTWNSYVDVCFCQNKESCEAYGNKWDGKRCVYLNDIDRCNNIKTKSGNEGCYWDNNYGCVCSDQKNCEASGCKWASATGSCICAPCAESEIITINGITGCLDKSKSDAIINRFIYNNSPNNKKYASFINNLFAKLILKDENLGVQGNTPYTSYTDVNAKQIKDQCNATKGCKFIEAGEITGCECVSTFCDKFNKPTGNLNNLRRGCIDKKNADGSINGCDCPSIFSQSCGFKNPWFIKDVELYHFGADNYKGTDKHVAAYISDCPNNDANVCIPNQTQTAQDAYNEWYYGSYYKSASTTKEIVTPVIVTLADDPNSAETRNKINTLTNYPFHGVRLGDYDAVMNYFLPIMQIIPESVNVSTRGVHIKTHTTDDKWTGQVLSWMERTKINYFTADNDNNEVNKGDSVKISWSVANPVYNENNQAEIYLYPNIDEKGNIIDDSTQAYFAGKTGNVSGSINVKLDKTTTFYLTVKGISGEGVVYLMADPITVEVIDDGSKVDLKIKRITKGNDTRPYSDGAILIDKGDGVGLKWDSFNVNYCNVSSTPTISLWDGIKTVTGTVSIPGEYLDFGTTTFYIQCKSTLSGGGVVLDQATAIVIDPNSAVIGVKTVIKDSKGKTENYEGTIDFKLIGPQLLPDGDFTSKEYNVGVIDTENGDDYTLEYLSGGPNDSSFVGITPNAKQKVKPHSTTVYTMEFSTTNDIDKRAKINVRATLDGKEISKSNVNYKLIGPNTENKVYFVPSTSTVAIKNSQGDSYTLTYDGGLSGANLVSISPSDTQTVKAGELITFTLNFESCSNGDCCPNGNCLNPNPNPANPCKINIVGKYNNSDWNGNFAFNLYGPEKLSANSLPYTFDKVPGNAPYFLYSQSGGPTNAAISEISPSNGQVCPANGEITFTVNFADIASEKPSITLPPKEVGNNKPVAKIACNADDPSTCSGTIDNDSNTPTITLVNASTDPDGDIKSCLWEITGRSPINSCSAVTLGDEPGTYKAKLTVTDSRGNTDSTTITATVKAITELTVKFVWNPKIATAGKEVQFYDRSLVPKNVTTSLLWSFEDATTTASSTLYDPEPKVIFNSEGTKKVTLTVTASNGEKKSLTQEISVKKAVPQWKEVNPNQ